MPLYVDPATVETVLETAAPTVSATPATTPPPLPAGLRALADDVRDGHAEPDSTARRSLALALLDRGWEPASAAAASGLATAQVRALGRVRRPGTAAASVADALVAARRAATTTG